MYIMMVCILNYILTYNMNIFPLMYDLFNIAYDACNIDQKVAMVSPLPGGTYTPSQVDYRDAAYGNFTYQIVTQDLNEDDANELYSFLENPVFKNILATIYGDTGGSTTNVAAGSTPINHLANPLEISAGNSNSIQKRYYILFNIFMLVSTILYLY